MKLSVIQTVRIDTLFKMGFSYVCMLVPQIFATWIVVGSYLLFSKVIFILETISNNRASGTALKSHTWWLFGCQHRDSVSQTVARMRDEDREMRLPVLWEE